MNKSKLLKQIAALLVVSSSLNCVYAATLDLSAEENKADAEKSERLAQAKELLGKYYGHSIVHNGEEFTKVTDFIESQVKANLPAKFKAQWKKVSKTIISEARKYKFDPIFLMAVIQNESSFSPTTVGSVGEIGMMQVRPETAAWIAKRFNLSYKSKKNLFDPSTNIKLGAAYLSFLRERFDSHGRLYLAAYNMGETNVHRALDRQIWPKDYASQVMHRYIRFYTELRDTFAAVAQVD